MKLLQNLKIHLKKFLLILLNKILPKPATEVDKNNKLKKNIRVLNNIIK